MREDLADLIAVADVKSTPFTSMVNKGRAPVNTLFSWQADAYEKPKVTGIVDGTDVADYENAAKNRARIYDHIQVFRRTAKVSRLAQDVSDVAGLGKKKEMANSIRKKMVELKRDLEATFLSDNEAQDDDGSVPNMTRGLGKWIQATAQTYLPVPAAYRPASAQVDTTAVASLTEDDNVQALLQAIYDATGFDGNYTLFAGSTLRRRFTTMTRIIEGATSEKAAYTVRQFGTSMESESIKSTTSIFEGDYGIVSVTSSSFIGLDANGDPTKERGYLLNMKRVHLRYNSMPTVERLPDMGGGPRVLLESVCGLQVDNPLDCAKFTGGV